MELYKVLNILNNDMKKEPTIENARKILSALKTIDGNNYNQQILQNLILYPLIERINEINILNQNEIKRYLFTSIKYILEIIRINKITVFNVTLLTMIKEIYDLKEGHLKRNVSEEFKISVMESIDVLFRRAVSSIIEELYIKDNMNIISQAIFICAELINSEKFRKLRIISIKCMMCVLYINDDADFTDIVLRAQISNIAYIFSPKLFMTLLKVILDDEKQGKTLISLSIRALGRFLCLIMEDYNKEEAKNKMNDMNINTIIEKMSKKTDDIIKTEKDVLNFPKSKDKKTQAEIIQSLEKTSIWLNTAAQRLEPQMQKLLQLIGNQNDTIRSELSIMACTLIEKCSWHFEPCLSTIMEIIISLSYDKNSEILNRCMKTYRNMANNVNIETILEDMLLKLLIKLPRIICTGNEIEQISNFILFKGILKLLPELKFKIIILNQNILEQITSILLSAVELEVNIELLQNEYSIRFIDDDSQNVFVNLPWKKFKYLQNLNLIKEIEEICQIIGDSDILLNHLLNLFIKKTNVSNEIIILLTYLLKKTLKKKDFIKTILDEFVDNVHWELAIQSNQTHELEKIDYGDSSWYEDRTVGLYESAISIRCTDIKWKESEEESNSQNDVITINDAKFNVLHICLILEAFGTFAITLENEFQPYFLYSLPKILEKAGSSNFMIHVAGMFALKCYAKSSLNMNNVSEFIYHNIDYSLHFINNSMKKFGNSQRILDTLSVIIKYGTLECIPHIEGIINTVITESSNKYERSNILSFLKVFQMTLQAISLWTDTISNDKIATVDETELLNDDKLIKLSIGNWNILQKLNDIINSKDIDDIDWLTDNEEEEPPTSLNEKHFEKLVQDELNGNESKNENSEENYEINTDENVEKPIPKHIEMTLNILRRCLKSISSKNRDEKIVAIETISIGLNIIKDNENQLLPMVHLIWQPLAERVKDTDPIILRRCFSLLVTLSKLSKDFIYQRTTKDVLPILCNFLKKSSEESLKHSKEISYPNSQQFKLQTEILLDLPKILIIIEIKETLLNTVLDSVLLFLHKEQPKQLQNECVNFFNKLKRFDATAIHVKLLSYCEKLEYSSNNFQFLL